MKHIYEYNDMSSIENKTKYRALKRKLRFLIYEQECFQEELRRAQRKLLKASRDKSFLLDRLLQYERVEGSSSDSESTASSDSEKESKKNSETKKQKKKSKPIKVKAKKRKQRQLKSLLGGDRKPLPGNLNHNALGQQNSKLMDLMKVGASTVQLSASPLSTLGLPSPSQDLLLSGMSLSGFPSTSQPLTPHQPPSKLSSLLVGDSSAMGALMRAGLAAAAAGEKADKQSKKKYKKDMEKLSPRLHTSMYPNLLHPTPSSVQSGMIALSSHSSGKPTTPTVTTPSPVVETMDSKQGIRPLVNQRLKTEMGEELVIDLPND